MTQLASCSLRLATSRRGRRYLLAAAGALAVVVGVLGLARRESVYQVVGRTDAAWLVMDDAPDVLWPLAGGLFCLPTDGTATALADPACGDLAKLDLSGYVEPQLEVPRGSSVEASRRDGGGLQLVVNLPPGSPALLSDPYTQGRQAFGGRLVLLFADTPRRTFLFVATRGEFGRAPGLASGYLTQGGLAAFEESLGSDERYLAETAELTPGDLVRFRLPEGAVVRGFLAIPGDSSSGLEFVANAIADGIDVERSAGYGYHFAVSIGDRFRNDPLLQWLILALGVAVSIATIVTACSTTKVVIVRSTENDPG